MSVNLRYLLQLCKPDSATPGEIVIAAWEYTCYGKFDTRVLLDQVPAKVKTRLRDASSSVIESMTEDATGIYIGNSFEEGYEKSDLFIPRSFIEELAK